MQDFAISVCTLLSNEGKHTIKLAKCPRLLDLILSHAGVYNHAGLDGYMGGLYQETRRYDLLNFWTSVSTDRAASDLMLDHAKSNNNNKEGKGRRKRARNSNSRSDSFEGGGSFLAASERLADVYRRAEADLEAGEDDEDGLFASGRGIGTGELAGQRVLQVRLWMRWLLRILLI